jgi:M6 family metalloprotease-like protein
VTISSTPSTATTPAPVVPSPTPTITPVVSIASDFAQTAECKLGKPSNLPMDDGPMGSVGFPMKANEFPSTGNLKGLVILTDFSDVVATSEMREVWVNSTIPLAEKLFPYSSYGKLNLKIELTAKIYRMQKPSTYYNLVAGPSGGPIENGPEPKLDEVVIDGMKAADPDFDFNQYAFVTVAAPRSSTLILSGATGLGRIPATFDGKTFAQGDFVPLDANTPIDKPYRTLNFTHDIGHMLGLMHPYVSAAPSHGAWDIMWSFAFQNDFLGWNKWKLNWISDDQISCVTPETNASLIQLLSPIGTTTTDKKMLVIKINSTQAIAVEVRRKSPFEDLKGSDEGVLVYRVDTTKGSGSGPYTIVSNPRKVLVYQNFEAVLGTMKPGESVTEGGYTISVIQSGANGDYISVKKSA